MMDTYQRDCTSQLRLRSLSDSVPQRFSGGDWRYDYDAGSSSRDVSAFIDYSLMGVSSLQYQNPMTLMLSFGLPMIL